MKHWLNYVRPGVLRCWLVEKLKVKRVVAKLRDGILLDVSPVSCLGAEVLEKGVFEAELSWLFKSLIRAGDAVVDVGANEGYFTVLAARLGASRVIAIEPQVRLAPILRRQLELNQVSAELLSVALGEKKGVAQMSLGSALNTGSSSLVREGTGGSVDVEVRSIDELSATWPRVRLMKIDCEGYEEPILRGACEFLKQRRVDFLSVDYHTSIVGVEAVFRIDALVRDVGYDLSAVNGVWVYHLPELKEVLDAMGTVRVIGRDLE
jgi:FkbM family methyltransferase